MCMCVCLFVEKWCRKKSISVRIPCNFWKCLLCNRDGCQNQRINIKLHYFAPFKIKRKRENYSQKNKNNSPVNDSFGHLQKTSWMSKGWFLLSLKRGIEIWLQFYCKSLICIKTSKTDLFQSMKNETKSRLKLGKCTLVVTILVNKLEFCSKKTTLYLLILTPMC